MPSVRVYVAAAWLAGGMACAGGVPSPRALHGARIARTGTSAPDRAPLPAGRPTTSATERGAGEAQEERSELYVRCDEERRCPSAVGMLVVEEPTGSTPERCTASLIGPDRALTASHCLRPEQRHA